MKLSGKRSSTNYELEGAYCCTKNLLMTLKQTLFPSPLSPLWHSGPPSPRMPSLCGKKIMAQWPPYAFIVWEENQLMWLKTPPKPFNLCLGRTGGIAQYSMLHQYCTVFKPKDITDPTGRNHTHTPTHKKTTEVSTFQLRRWSLLESDSDGRLSFPFVT